MVYEKVISIIADQLNMDKCDIEEDSSFEILGASEDDLSEIILAVESEFEIEINDEDVLNLDGVSDIVDLIETSIELE